MRPPALLLPALLAGAALSASGQALFAPRPLCAYRLNELRVDGLPSGREASVRVVGLTPQGREPVLFEASARRGPGSLSAYCYLEPDVAAVRVIVEAEGRPAWSGELAVEPELLVVRVAVGPVEESSPVTPHSADRRFLFVGSPEQLQPGDVYVGSAGNGERGLREALRARGVHVLPAGGPAGPEGSEEAGPEGSEDADPLRGRDLGPLESLDRLPQALAARWEDLLAYKEGFVGLVSQRRLHGLPPAAAEKAGAGMAGKGTSATFAGRAEEAAFRLERQVIPARLEAGTRLALLAFYVLAMGLLVVRPRLAALGALAAMFLAYAFLFPERQRVLTLELNAQHLQQTVAWTPREAAAGLLARAPRHLRFVAAGYAPSRWRLRYRAELGPGGKAPLDPYREAERVRFNQVPRVVLRRGGYALEYAGVLRSWSIHEPQ